MVRDQTDALPYVAACAFGEQHGLGRKIKEIEDLKPVRWSKSPTTGVLRGYIVELFEKHGLFEEFKRDHWLNGNTKKGKNAGVTLIERYRGWKREYEDEKGTSRPTPIAKVRKYGPGGEGKDHKELKEWISTHPELLNLTDVSRVTVEHTYISGDIADIVFAHKSGCHTVVEIETTTPLPGAHQAIKYRALQCAEIGLPLDTDKVKAFLVAWAIPLAVRDFCKKYDLGFREYSLSAKS